MVDAKLINSLGDVFKNVEISPKSLSLKYGTPGYRCEASLLHGIAARVGLYSCLRSLVKNGLAVGIVITASHNLSGDNGLKVIDSDGGMLPPEFESGLVEFVRSTPTTVAEWVKKYLNGIQNPTVVPKVFLGYDTRSSSVGLANEVKVGIQAAGGICIDCGLTTTPQLHLYVQLQEKVDYTSQFSRNFARAFASLRSGGDSTLLNVDCAHGVGSLAVTDLARRLQMEFSKPEYPVNSPRLILRAFNVLIEKKDLLNRECGADFVKLHCRRPTLTPEDTAAFSGIENNRWATIDGDADRLLLFYPRPRPDDRLAVALLDGDRIAALFAAFLKDQLSRGDKHHLTIGLVLTAYSNAGASHYLEHELGVNVEYARTGVKHLHKAAKKFDFGVYFEANGHGTVEFSEAAKKYIYSLAKDDFLSLFYSLVNTAVGDAVADILLVEFLLALRGLSFDQWMSVYTDMPCCQLKVVIRDRNHVVVTEDERLTLKPEGIQAAIDALIARASEAAGKPGVTRAFIRPSGTEDIVRVYAESATKPLADWLACSVARLVYDEIEGVDPAPVLASPLPL